MNEKQLDDYLNHLYSEIESNERKLKELDCVPPGLPVTDANRERCATLRSELEILRSEARKAEKQIQ